MKFGVFDHVDRGDVPLTQHYENRFRLAQVYDRKGFHAYQIAEHHSTPLGMASSPSVSFPRSHSAPSACAWEPWSTRCRWRTRCGFSRRSACSTR